MVEPNQQSADTEADQTITETLTTEVINSSGNVREFPVSPINITEHVNVTEAPLGALPKAGYNLARFILFIISGYILFLVLFLLFKNIDASQAITKAMPGVNLSDSTFAHQKDIIRSLQDEQKNNRDFIIQVSQMVLLNLLLPILTAILGYIFGTREEQLRRSTAGQSG